MAWLAAVASLAGTATTVIGQQQQGAANENAAESAAAQLRQNANASRAMAQRESINQQKQTQLMMSRAQALAAASGGSATDPTVVKTIGDIAGEGEYRRLTALYNGEQQATGQEAQANAAVSQGKAYQQAANLKSVSTVLNYGSSYYQKYGQPLKSNNASDPGMAAY